jgi:hypothetical protein
VDEILDKVEAGKKMLLIKWKGYNNNNNNNEELTWEPAEIIEADVPAMVKKFEKDYKAREELVAVTQTRRKRQSNEMQNGVADKPHPAERSKARPHHIRGQLSNDFDRVSEASIQSLLRPKESPADKQEIELIRDMKARGILFESDDDSDDGPEVPAG